MEIFKWTDDLLTGDEVVDFQHKKLFNYLNILIIAINNKDKKNINIKNTVYSLVEYTMIHFADEEALLKTNVYPNISEHKKIHRDFEFRVLNLKERYDQGEDIVEEITELVLNWFIEHIKTEDQKALKYRVE